jgi:hypothetical protein
MLSGILGLLGLLPKAFDTIDNITNAISNEKIAQINAVTDQEKVAAQERISALQSARDVLVEDTKHSNLDIYIRSAIGAGVASYIVKYFAWDKVVGSFVGCNGHTDPGTCMIFQTDGLDVNMVLVMSVAIGFYFVHSMVRGK